jgi:protein-L-isoaspartate(D-aspartate) O-methyltransferase
MVEKVRKAGHAQPSEAERILHNTPRHEFVPDADPTVIYDS